MKRKFFVTLLSACLMILVGYFLLADEGEPAPTRTPVRTKAASAATNIPYPTQAASAISITPAATKAAPTQAASATLAGTRPAGPTPARTASLRPTLAATRAGSTAVPVFLTPATALVRFRVGVTTAYNLMVDPNAWEAYGIPTPTGVAYGLTYKKLPACRLQDEAGRDAPAGWTHFNLTKSLGGRTYTLEYWSNPETDRYETVIFALDPRIRVELSTASGNSECIQAAENMIAASTQALSNP